MKKQIVPWLQSAQDKRAMRVFRNEHITAVFVIILFTTIGVILVKNLSPKQPGTNAATNNITLTTPSIVSKFRTGVTLTQDAHMSGNTAPVPTMKALMNGSSFNVNTHIMGWGTSDPEPNPGVYDWASMDDRINNWLSGTNTKVITECCAPWWMKGSTQANDWTDIEKAPTPAHYTDYVNLALTAVRRYHTTVKYYQFWNEMKGLWIGDPTYGWNVVDYTTMYNSFYTQAKAIDPTVKIGGPYVVLDSFGGSNSEASTVGGSWGKFDKRDLAVVQYWLQHKVGADFITVDASDVNKDTTPSDLFTMSPKFSDFATWLRSQNNTTYPGATTLPLWWAEWYARPASGATTANKNALMSDIILNMAKSGVENPMLWGPEGAADGSYDPLALFGTSANTTLYYETQKSMHDNFVAGTQLYNTTNNNTNLNIVASNDHMLIVNKSSSSQSFSVYGTAYTLAAYEVKTVIFTSGTGGGNTGIGDCNNDGHVSITDLSTMLSHFGQTTSICDTNGDSKIDITDLSTLISHFGT